jgi:DNA-directed RNA polymerase subunit RPC12/RpoP
MFTRTFDRKVHLALKVSMLSLLILVVFGAYVLWPSNMEAGYQPEQPLPFNHALHAGTLKIDCRYCHAAVEWSQHATVPQLSTCMNCHSEVKPVDATGRVVAGVKILLDHWQRKAEIRWQKVNDLADFVYFDHSRHVNSDIACQDCHGRVETMERVSRQFGMKMSWCLDCHRQSPPVGSHAAKEGWATRAPIECATCHR